jgi:hypothetical protein
VIDNEELRPFDRFRLDDVKAALSILDAKTEFSVFHLLFDIVAITKLKVL